MMSFVDSSPRPLIELRQLDMERYSGRLLRHRFFRMNCTKPVKCRQYRVQIQEVPHAEGARRARLEACTAAMQPISLQPPLPM